MYNTMPEAFNEDSLGCLTRWQRIRKRTSPAQKRPRTEWLHYNKSALWTLSLLQGGSGNSLSVWYPCHLTPSVRPHLLKVLSPLLYHNGDLDAGIKLMGRTNHIQDRATWLSCDNMASVCLLTHCACM